MHLLKNNEKFEVSFEGISIIIGTFWERILENIYINNLESKLDNVIFTNLTERQEEFYNCMKLEIENYYEKGEKND